MQRATIDYGIDLGTTNSAIAVLQGTEPRVITNQAGSSFTPSAVWIDKRGRLHVGQEAKQRWEEDPQNCDVEFKLRMGQAAKGTKVFAETGRKMLPEELSAEVLKSLKADVRSNTGEDLRAAVISVPAAFGLGECDATRGAAELAGFSTCPLLQEPVAAALAYGFQQESDRVFWLVYDFGGGTFDAAIMQVRDGVIQVVNHAGDMRLGGKLIDWDIVEKLLIPALTRKFSLSDFRRGNEHWRPAIAKLKNDAEKAKIEVSRKRAASLIWIEGLCKDDRGQTIDFEYELTPEEVREIVTPYITRSLNLCRKALEEKRLSGRDLEKVLMVGGSSLFPWLQDRVLEELGAPLEFRIDPITVVARGAAIFAATQRLPVGEAAAVPTGTFRIDLEYEPVGSDTDPLVAGRVHHAQGGSLQGYTVEFVEVRSEWRSGKISLGEEGTFMTQVHAEKERQCEFLIELCNPTGGRLQTTPDRFAYTVGMVITSPPLTHSVGVAMANNETDFFLAKGTPLPARVRIIHRTAYTVRQGQEGASIRIPLVEGENGRADRNRLIGKIEITSDKIRRDVPAGSDVEITIHIDQARLVTTKAYIPILDEELDAVHELEMTLSSVGTLRESLQQEQRRLSAARGKARDTGDAKAKEALARIDGEQMREQVESLLVAAEGDPDAVAECERRLLDLKAAADEVEDALEWPTLVAEAQEALRDARRVVNEHGQPDDKERLRTLENDLEKAIDSRDADVLRRQGDEFRSLNAEVITRQPGFWVGLFHYLEERRSQMRDSAQAEQLFGQGRRAMSTNDVEALKAVDRQLMGLLPADEQEKARGYGGTTIR